MEMLFNILSKYQHGLNRSSSAKRRFPDHIMYCCYEICKHVNLIALTGVFKSNVYSGRLHNNQCLYGPFTSILVRECTSETFHRRDNLILHLAWRRMLLNAPQLRVRYLLPVVCV